MKRALAVLLALTLCLLSAASRAEDDPWILTIGDKGKTVIELHKRLKELRYIQDKKVSNLFSEKTEEAIRSFQQLNIKKAFSQQRAAADEQLLRLYSVTVFQLHLHIHADVVLLSYTYQICAGLKYFFQITVPDYYIKV